jgi:hypothetical protein
LHGKARTGKSTAADHLRTKYGFYEMAFAAPIRVATSIMFGWPVEITFTQEGKAMRSPYWDITVRKALQDVGQGMRDIFGDDFWIRRWQMDYVQVMDQYNIVVSDVRYENEADVIRKLGGHIFHIIRDEGGLVGEEASHSSEHGLIPDDGDIVIHNDKTLPEFIQRIDAALEFLKPAGNDVVRQ